MRTIWAHWKYTIMLALVVLLVLGGCVAMAQKFQNCSERGLTPMRDAWGAYHCVEVAD